jgi:16S rRNA (uracil1498-N3)-methyltransferase
MKRGRNIYGTVLPLDAAPQHYVQNVLRLHDGADVHIFNGTDGTWRAILQLSGKRAALYLQECLAPQQNVPDVGLLFAPIKRSPIDFLAQKATELGARWLQPLRTARTIVSRVNEERLLSNVTEAAEQSERDTLPRLEPFISLEQRLDTWPAATWLLFCDESQNAPALRTALEAHRTHWADPWAILIGPEGGFTPEEAARIRHLPTCVPCHLGPRILRADTAALAALAAWQSITQ